jgi:cyclopropane-fatty-acyl-phospholipid synthase
MLINYTKKHVPNCSLTLKSPKRTIILGNGPGSVIRVKNEKTLYKLLLRPDFCFGDQYVKGNWELEDSNDSLLYVFRFLFSLSRRLTWLNSLKRRLPVLSNSIDRSRVNVRHYNSDPELFKLMLDPNMFYTCGYFPHVGMTLEEGQLAKAQHIAKKLRIQPGMNVLDIGSGWGH